MVGPQQTFFVLPTAEVRWFFKGAVPPDINKWFSEQGYKPDNQPCRIDYYLFIMDSDSLGIKLREGRMEIKQRHEKPSVIEFGEHAKGYVEHWYKWSFHLSETSNIDKILKSYSSSWTGIKKERLMFMYYITDNGEVKEISFQPPQNLAESKTNRRCGFELAKISVETSGEKWWSLGFEAFGNDTDLNNNLLFVLNIVMIFIYRYYFISLTGFMNLK